MFIHIFIDMIKTNKYISELVISCFLSMNAELIKRQLLTKKMEDDFNNSLKTNKNIINKRR